MDTVKDLIRKGYSYSEGLPPLVFNRPKTLILGELPGRDSIKANEYYINKRNRFWSLMAEILDVDCPVTKEEKYNLLMQHNIALWDVFKSGYRKGSKSPVKQGEVNDIVSFLRNYPTIYQIVLVGSWAKKAFEKNFDVSINVIPVTSTSGANVYWNKQKQAWYEIEFG